MSPGVANVGDVMTGSVWFKAHTAGDNSSIAIETGNPVGDDRAEILAYVENLAGGLTIRSFDGGAFTNVPIASELDASLWHELSFSLTLTATDNAVSISVDGSAPVAFDGSLKEFRDDSFVPDSESSRLNFLLGTRMAIWRSTASIWTTLATRSRLLCRNRLLSLSSVLL